MGISDAQIGLRRNSMKLQPTIPTYARSVTEMFLRGEFKPGVVSHVNVKHDDWCSNWQGQQCNCDFEVQRMPEPKGRMQ